MDTKGKDTEVRKGLMCPRSKVEYREEKGSWYGSSLGRGQILLDKLARDPKWNLNYKGNLLAQLKSRGMAWGYTGLQKSQQDLVFSIS